MGCVPYLRDCKKCNLSTALIGRCTSSPYLDSINASSICEPAELNTVPVTPNSNGERGSFVTIEISPVPDSSILTIKSSVTPALIVAGSA